MNLVLIGYRGTGKSALGRRLAARLKMDYVGFDAEIVRRAGRTIPDIVRESGWDRFRDMESEVTRELSSRDGAVLDTGGGVVLRPENVAHLKRNGVVFWLQATVADIVRRIGGDDQRPALTGAASLAEEVENVLAQRTALYAAAADECVDTSTRSLDDAVAWMASRFRSRLANQSRGPSRAS